MSEKLTTEEILSNLDLDKVAEVALRGKDGTGNLLAHDFEDCKLMIWAAAEKWLLPDLQTLSASSLGLEEAFQIPLGGYPVRGFLDLRGSYRRGADQGKVVVADWKTSSGELDVAWQSRLVDSKQWRLYSLVPPGADFISYRGVNTKGKTREVYLDLAKVEGIREDVENYFGGVGDMMKTLAPRDIWPQNKPSACGQYGQTCFAKSQCDNGTQPRYLLPAEHILLSYSGAGRFLACPERYRLLKNAESGIDGTDSTRLGNAYHAGIEELYRQAFLKYGED